MDMHEMVNGRPTSERPPVDERELSTGTYFDHWARRTANPLAFVRAEVGLAARIASGTDPAYKDGSEFQRQMECVQLLEEAARSVGSVSQHAYWMRDFAVPEEGQAAAREMTERLLDASETVLVQLARIRNSGLLQKEGESSLRTITDTVEEARSFLKRRLETLS